MYNVNMKFERNKLSTCRKKWVSYSIVGFFDYIRKRIKYFYNPAFAHLEDDKNVSGSITFNVVGV